MSAVTTLAALLVLSHPVQSQVAKPYDKITPSTIMAHLKFLSSDLLEGRGTPSRGLDIAAEYIAAQFQLAGLEPAGDDGYFQTSEFTNRRSQVTGKVRNVIGILKGTDPKLKDTYVIVSGHYDHLGKREGEGDTIYNGANDDGSGTTGVIECARALSGLKPKRTIVFMCFWGEEAGLQGSRYYAQHPIFPLAKTIANVNLEQIGRTDDDEGPRVSEFNITGFDYTNLADIMTKAGKQFGVKVTKHPRFSDAYFNASDNAALANVGVPANTISVAYSFPDYHKVGDEWPKIDADNMAKIVRTACAGLWDIANSAEPVKWIESDKTKRYIDAWKKLQGG